MFNMLFANTLILLNLSSFSSKCLSKKNNSKIFSLFLFILGVLLLSNINYPNKKLLGFFFMTIFYASYIFFLYKGNVYKKILVLVLFSIVLSFSEIISANIMNVLFQLSSEQINTTLYFLAIFISNALAFLLLYFFSKILTSIVEINYSPFMWVGLVIPLTTIILLLNISDYFNTFRNNTSLLFVMSGLLLSNILFVYVLLKESKQMKLDAEVKLIRQKNELLKSQYDSNFSFLHDTIRELLKLDTLFSTRDYEKAHAKVRELNKNLIKFFNVINTNSVMISSLMNHHIKTILQYNINVNTVIEFNDFSFLTKEEQQILFSELIEIAMNSCINTKLVKPNILMKTKKVNKSSIVVKCSFSYREGYKLDTKQLEEIVNKYKGRIDIEYDCVTGFSYANIFIIFLQ